MFNCYAATDTRGYVRNKVASVVVGVCVVAQAPLAFAELFAQDCALLVARMPGCQVARLRIGHGYGYGYGYGYAATLPGC